MASESINLRIRIRNYDEWRRIFNKQRWTTQHQFLIFYVIWQLMHLFCVMDTFLVTSTARAHQISLKFLLNYGYYLLSTCKDFIFRRLLPTGLGQFEFFHRVAKCFDKQLRGNASPCPPGQFWRPALKLDTQRNAEASSILKLALRKSFTQD